MVSYTSVYNGTEIDRLLSYVGYLEQSNTQPIGIKYNSSSNSPTLTRIDINGNTITPSASFFNNHAVWGGIRRCVRNRSTGVITYGSNRAGAGLALDGSSGDVLVEIPTAKYKFAKSGGDYYFWIIPYSWEDTKYTNHPASLQRSGDPRTKIYVGAYEAGLLDANGTLKLTSVTNSQPFTGGTIYSFSFTSGSIEPTVNETMVCVQSGATGIVVSYHLTSGTWTGGDAAGVIYIRQVVGTWQAGQVDGSTSGTDSLTSSGSATSTPLTISNAETYANNIGTGFGICNIWTYAYIQLLMYIEYGTLDLQSSTAIGKGVIDEASGSGYGGKLTGADSIDSRLGTNGTGVGSGITGHTPVCWRGIENPWGNIWEFAIGINFMMSDYSCRIIKRDGTGTMSPTLADGSYEVLSSPIPNTDGYILGIQPDETGALSFTPQLVGGTSSTYFCDQYFKPSAATSILMVSGKWASGYGAGPSHRTAFYPPTTTTRECGARIEFLP